MVGESICNGHDCSNSSNRKIQSSRSVTHIVVLEVAMVKVVVVVVEVVVMLVKVVIVAIVLMMAVVVAVVVLAVVVVVEYRASVGGSKGVVQDMEIELTECMF